MDYSYVSNAEMAEEADRAMMHVALACAGRPSPMLIESLGPDDGYALAVPLRVHGELRFVLCLWNRSQEFDSRQLESLGLMGRMIELAIEREESLAESQSQLEGTLNVLQYLVSDKRPDYADHAMRVAGLASDLGTVLGMTAVERRDLRFAGLLHDVGIMTLDQDFSDASQPLTHEERLVVQQHPRISSEIAAVAQFDVEVQKSIAGHHERVDGSGYPDGARGEAIPMAARVLAVCEVFDSMTHRTYHGEAASRQVALDELRHNAGSLYDTKVVAAMLQLFPDTRPVDVPVFINDGEAPIMAAAGFVGDD
jgi:putative nucleotidyltransferase with HDIG domain